MSMEMKTRMSLGRSLTTEQWNKLCNIFDQGGLWKRIMAACPDKWYDAESQLRFEKKTSPSHALLKDFCLKAMNLEIFMKLLYCLRLERPLELMNKEREPIEIVSQPPPHIELDHLQPNLIITFSAKGFPFPRYSWWKLSLDNHWELVFESLEPQLRGTQIISTINNLEGKYICTVENECGRKETDIVEVSLLKADFDDDDDKEDSSIELLAPQIIKEPTCPANVFAGNNILLIVEVKGAEPLKYQWYINNELLKGSTSKILEFKNVRPYKGSTTVKFNCRITNPYGEVLSEQATMNIDLSAAGGQFTATAKMALIVGNSCYKDLGPLQATKNDVISLGRSLTKFNFKVYQYIDLDLEATHKYFNEFCEKIVCGAYVVFYFAGHGFSVKHQPYMLPCDAPKNYKASDSICVQDQINKISQRKPAVSFFMLDMCRSDPDNGHKDIKQQCEIVRPIPRQNTIVLHSTSESQRAYECTYSENGFFMQHFLKALESHSDETIEQLAFKVKQFLSCDTHLYQPDSDTNLQIAEARSTLCEARRLTDFTSNIVSM